MRRRDRREVRLKGPDGGREAEDGELPIDVVRVSDRVQGCSEVLEDGRHGWRRRRDDDHELRLSSAENKDGRARFSRLRSSNACAV